MDLPWQSRQITLVCGFDRVQAAYQPRAEGKRLGPVGRELLPMETIGMDAMPTPAARALPALHTWGLGIGVSTSEAVGGCGSG